MKHLQKTLLIILVVAAPFFTAHAQVTSFSQLGNGDVIVLEQAVSGYYVGSENIGTNHARAVLSAASVYDENLQWIVGGVNAANKEIQFRVKSTEDATPYYLHTSTSNTWSVQVGEYTSGGRTTWYADFTSDGMLYIKSAVSSNNKILGTDQIEAGSALYYDKDATVADIKSRAQWRMYKVADLQNDSIANYLSLKKTIDKDSVAIYTYGRTNLIPVYQQMRAAYAARNWSAEQIKDAIQASESLFYVETLEPVNRNLYQIKQRIYIDSVETSFPVNFKQTIVGDNHYIAYYDKDKNFCIGYRKLTDLRFSKTILNSKIGWDSHNYTEMIVDDEGYIHVSGNMHSSALRYWRSARPYDPAEFTQLHYMTGSNETATTYPAFLKTASGDLLFHYRDGVSGGGSEIYNIWNPASQTWSRFLDQALIDGKGARNAYMQGPYYEADGYYHLYWVWRETPDCSTNHSFSYARSRDLKNWENVAGVSVANPMVYDETALYVDKITQTSGLGVLNGVQAHTLDSQNNIVLCNMKYDSLGNSELYAYRYEKGAWIEKRVTGWYYRFNFSGGGSIIFEIQIKGMRNLGDGQLGISYYHSKYGTGEIVLDENTLEPIKIKEYANAYPEELDVVTTQGTYSKPIYARINQLGPYIMRWETMDQSNDQKPAGQLPPMYGMELIEIEPKGEAGMPASKATAGSLHVVNDRSVLKIKGLETGKDVCVVNSLGMALYKFTAKDPTCTIPTPASGCYIVYSGKNSCKFLVR